MEPSELEQAKQNCSTDIEEHLYKIGMFAAMNHVTIKALRYYDELFTKMPQMGQEMEKLGCECSLPECCFTNYLDFLDVFLFVLLALRTTVFLAVAVAFTDFTVFTAVAGFKIIDFAALKLVGLISFFFGIKTFKEDEAFLGAFKLNEACEAN